MRRLIALLVVALLLPLTAGCPKKTDPHVDRNKNEPCTKDCSVIHISIGSKTERTSWVRIDTSTPDGHVEHLRGQGKDRPAYVRIPFDVFVTYSKTVHVTIKVWAEVDYGKKLDVTIPRSVTISMFKDGALIPSTVVTDHEVAFSKYTT